MKSDCKNGAMSFKLQAMSYETNESNITISLAACCSQLAAH